MIYCVQLISESNILQGKEYIKSQTLSPDEESSYSEWSHIIEQKKIPIKYNYSFGKNNFEDFSNQVKSAIETN